jgi:ADP-ribose pyrophosphatase YjhB (NUDIX family)
MPKPVLSKSKDGQPMHYSVGALIQKDGKYLLIDREIKPYGYAGPAGHIDEGETKEQALVREVKEETGLGILL